MAEQAPNIELPPIPAKRYFTIGEVSDLCGVKPHVLRYWEQEFTQLSPVKRRGNRRYYQHHEVLLIRRIRELLYDDGFTIHGARNLLDTKGRVKFDKDLTSEHSPAEELNKPPSVREGRFEFKGLMQELKAISTLLAVES